jgi:hypothetical protein
MSSFPSLHFTNALRRVSQVPVRSVDTRRPLSPRKARPVHMPVASWSVTGFSISGRLATFDWCNEAETGSILAARTFAARGFAPWITPRHARLATMSNGQFTWQAPFRLRGLTNLPWRTESTKTNAGVPFVLSFFRAFVIHKYFSRPRAFSSSTIFLMLPSSSRCATKIASPSWMMMRSLTPSVAISFPLSPAMTQWCVSSPR